MAYNLETRRILLRNITLEDAQEYYDQIWSQPEVMRYLPGGAPRAREQTETYINYFSNHWETHGFGLWGVEFKETGKFIGHCGIQIIQETQEIEVAYAFAQSHWGQGIGTETAHASLRFGFETLQLERIIAIAVPENIPSRRIMEKNGMRYEGLKRILGYDLAYYVLFRHEFLPNEEPYSLRKF